MDTIGKRQVSTLLGLGLHMTLTLCPFASDAEQGFPNVKTQCDGMFLKTRPGPKMGAAHSPILHVAPEALASANASSVVCWGGRIETNWFKRNNQCSKISSTRHDSCESLRLELAWFEMRSHSL